MELIDKADIVAAIKTIYNEDYKFLPSDLVESVQDFKDDLLTALDGISTVKNANDAYKQGYNDAIDKAWDWIEDNMLSSNQQDKSLLYYEQFKNYIKGE